MPTRLQPLARPGAMPHAIPASDTVVDRRLGAQRRTRHPGNRRTVQRMDFRELTSRAHHVREQYARWEEGRYGRSWTTEEIALGLVGDVGDLMKLVQGKAGVRPHPDLDKALAHELADCLWAVMILADRYGVDLEAAFLRTMSGLELSLNEHTDRKDGDRPLGSTPAAPPSGHGGGSMIHQSTTTETPIDGLVVNRLKHAEDARGAVREFYRASVWAKDHLSARMAGPWLQVNVTETRRGAVRGLHGEAMNKLVGIVSGQAIGVYLDAREDSRTYGAVHTVLLEKGTQVFVPRGVCNGFQSLANETQYLYCFDDEWRPGMPGTAFTPLSPDLGITWPIPVNPDDPSQISIKDRDAAVWGTHQR